MDKKKILHPIAAILLMAVIIFGCQLAISAQIYSYVADFGYEMYMTIYPFMEILYWLVYPSIAALICVKVIDKRQLRVWVLLLIVLCVNFFCMIHWKIGTIVFGSYYGDLALAQFSQVKVYLAPVVTAALIALYVHIFDKPKVDADPHDRKMFCGMAEHTLLMLFSFGIWFLVWVYRTTAYLNCVKGEEQRNPVSKLLLCMFVPFYGIYWTYKSARRIDTLANSCGIASDITIPCLLLEIFIPVIPPILMQDKINKIIASGEPVPVARTEKDPWDI